MSSTPAKEALTEPWPKGQSDTVSVSAPAKINLFLHVTGRRADGMHELQTLFQFLDWGDRLEITPLAEPRFERTGSPGAVPEANDLALRAARLLAEATGHDGGVTIGLDKRLPVGGGLGGGSSDAATTLLVLNRLWGCGLDQGELVALGAQLGADIPVFIGGTAAWAEGIGERLTPVPEMLTEPWYLLLWPEGVGVTTKEVFADPALTRDHPRVTIRDFSRGRCTNDFEAVVTRRMPDIAEARDWLQGQVPERVHMTGSGVCLFVGLADRGSAEALRRRVPAQWNAVVARGRNRHPLADWALSGGV